MRIKYIGIGYCTRNFSKMQAFYDTIMASVWRPVRGNGISYRRWGIKDEAGLYRNKNWGNMAFGGTLLDISCAVCIKMKKSKKMVAFFNFTHYNTKCASGCGSAWLERRLREAEVASSNPATPIHEEVSKP